MDNQSRVLSDSIFNKFCALIYQESGIRLTEEKRALLNARLSKRLRRVGVTATEYYDLINHDQDELGRFIDAVSTNHTYFFRESRSFQFIPDHCAEIWCAASSSGEEPYSVAAHCLERGFSPGILATDISETCLKKAGTGVYPDQCIKNIPEKLLKSYFQKGRNQWQGYVRIKPALKKMVQFKKFNLLKDVLPDRSFDVIFCRNVMIYFDAPTKEKVVERLTSVLKPQGYFIIGGAESLSGLKHTLKYIEPSVYQKSETNQKIRKMEK